ncbi:ABC transporter substrate-binding protein [Stygiolobus caldivivus]|uniref:Iron ABC transporter substrate-binding protein n=1 Tax=Stygiolobus caldivivus TaxID=2824673 RepID=A0A8D5ZI60_9CREN|nr:ABC transporter substrate-binding protein [Stygiolobus caldivivus]BCU69316.1 iron ABC transporter substrate-binding protein [Stygiolobus caldivivus]
MRRVYNEIFDDFISLPDKIKKIVSLDPATTESLFMMGLGDKVIATDAFSYRPEEARKKPKIGSYTHVNEDFLRQNKPDVIFTTTGAQKALTKRLVEEGYTVYPLGVSNSVYRIINNVEVVSLVCNVKEEGRRLASFLLGQLSRYTVERTIRAKVYVEFDLGGVITSGYPTHVSDAIYLVGGRNIFDDKDEAYFTPFDQDIMSREPDVIIYEPKRLNEYEKERFMRKMRERGLEELIKNKKVVFTIGDFLAHQGPSFITDGLKFLHEVINKT